jgi:hypothetical protein
MFHKSSVGRLFVTCDGALGRPNLPVSSFFTLWFFKVSAPTKEQELPAPLYLSIEE